MPISATEAVSLYTKLHQQLQKTRNINNKRKSINEDIINGNRRKSRKTEAVKTISVADLKGQLPMQQLPVQQLAHITNAPWMTVRVKSTSPQLSCPTSIQETTVPETVVPKTTDLETTVLAADSVPNVRVYSNDMSDACKHKCHICGKLITLTTMRAHTKNNHGLAIKEYMEQFGNYREQMAREVYHQCKLCGEDILLDGDELHKHCNKHRIRMKEYTAQFISLVTDFRGRKTEVEDGSQKVEKEEKTSSKSVLDTILDIENLVESIYA